MDGKLLARIGAAVFVGIAVAITLIEMNGVQMGEETATRPEPVPSEWVPDGDPLPAQLRACAEMGELALSSPDCRAAWAEKRRRFFGTDHPDAYTDIDPVPETPATGLPTPEQRGED